MPRDHLSLDPAAVGTEGDPVEYLLRSLADAALVVRDGKAVVANRAALELLQLEADAQLSERPVRKWIHPSFRDSWTTRVNDAQVGNAFAPRDEYIIARDGTSVHVETAVSPVMIDGKPAALCIMRRVRVAIEDPLTKLPTRALLMDRLTHALTQVSRRSGHVAVLFVDIDQFKVVNDSMGHSFGDLLLVEVGRRLLTTVRAGDTLARFGGDEFIVLCDCVDGLADAERLAERITEALSRPFELGGSEFQLSASIGLVLAAAGATAETVVRDADSALHQAKAAGRNRTDVFDDSTRARTVARFDAMSALRQTLDKEELELHYQPIVDLSSGAMVGLEALVRWNRAGRLVSPAEFIPAAEENGLIQPLGRLVVTLACQEIARWKKAGLSVPIVSVNLSTRQLSDAALIPHVSAQLTAHNIDPAKLRFEVTESRLMQNLEQAKSALTELRDIGVTLAIDDFGTGYSSLAQLRALPFGCLKLDQSFVADIASGEAGERLLESVLHLAESLSMSVVAEGVETHEQFMALRRLGYTVGQGYHFSRPLPARALDALLAERPSMLPPAPDTTTA